MIAIISANLRNIDDCRSGATTDLGHRPLKGRVLRPWCDDDHLDFRQLRLQRLNRLRQIVMVQTGGTTSSGLLVIPILKDDHIWLIGRHTTDIGQTARADGRTTPPSASQRDLKAEGLLNISRN